mgnify:CR=1 FL=1
MIPYNSFERGINTIASKGNMPVEFARQLHNCKFIDGTTLAPRNGSMAIDDLLTKVVIKHALVKENAEFIGVVPFPKPDKTIDYMIVLNYLDIGHVYDLYGDINYVSSSKINAVKYAFHSKLGKTYIVTGNDYLELYVNGEGITVLTNVERYEVNSYDLNLGFNALDDDPFHIEDDTDAGTVFPIGLFAYDKDPYDPTSKILTSWILGKEFYLKMAYGKPSGEDVEFKFEYRDLINIDSEWKNFNEVEEKIWFYNKFYNGKFQIEDTDAIFPRPDGFAVMPNYPNIGNYRTAVIECGVESGVFKFKTQGEDSEGNVELAPVIKAGFSIKFRNPKNEPISLKRGHKYRLDMFMKFNAFDRYKYNPSTSTYENTGEGTFKLQIGDSSSRYQQFSTTDDFIAIRPLLGAFNHSVQCIFTVDEAFSELFIFDDTGTNIYTAIDMEMSFISLIDITEHNTSNKDITLVDIVTLDEHIDNPVLPTDYDIDYYIEELGAWQNEAVYLVQTGRLTNSGYALRGSIRRKDDVNNNTTQTIPIAQFLLYGSDQNPEYVISDLTKARNIMYYWNQIILYGQREFKNTLYISDIDAPDFFPMPLNTVEVPSDLTSDIYKLLKFKDSIIIFTFKGVFMIKDGKVPEDMKFITLNPDIGMYEKDAETPKIVGNAVLFKGGDRVYALIPQQTAMDDSMLNIREVDRNIYNSFPSVDDYKYSIAINHKNVYYLAFIMDNKTLIFKFHYQQNAWLTEEYAFEIKQFIKHNIESLYCTTNTGQFVQLDLPFEKLFEQGLDKLADYYYINSVLTDSLFNVIIETGGNELNYKFHLKKFKELQFLFTHKDYNPIDLKVTIKVNSSEVYSPSGEVEYTLDEQGYIQTNIPEEDNLHLATGALLGLWELGESPFGETDVLKHIIKYQGKGYNVSFKIEAYKGEYFEFIGYMHIFKLKKAK